MEGLEEITNALSNGTIHDPYGLSFLEIGGLQLSYPQSHMHLSREQVKLAIGLRQTWQVHLQGQSELDSKAVA